MPLFTRLQVATAMLETGIVPVFYHKDLTTCKNVLKACYDGGIRVLNSPTGAISPMRYSGI
jgi:2-dehydro-3-deoxyphosphogluconate aldolase/(4S)-4-hydroxy-2-oxoglutarate aldolase